MPISLTYDQNKFSIVLLIKTIDKIAIFEKSFLGLIKEFLIFFFDKCANTPSSCLESRKFPENRSKNILKINFKLEKNAKTHQNNSGKMIENMT